MAGRHTIVLLMLVGISIPARAADQEGVSITIYSSPGSRTTQSRQIWENGRYVTRGGGYAMVRESRFIELRGDAGAGTSTVRFTDVAKKIRPETVRFTSLTDPAGTFVLEQNYEYDLVSPRKLLQKYVGRSVTLVSEDEGSRGETETVTLLATAGDRSYGYVLRTANPEEPIEIRGSLGRVRLGALPGGLITRPTLVWKLKARRPGRHLCRVGYETQGIVWYASYTAVIGEDEKSLDLSGWVTIKNETGATYDDAKIKLVAGDVKGTGAASGSSGGSSGGTTGGAWGTMRSRQGGFKGKRFFEHHLYTLGRRSTLKDNSQKQLELFEPVDGVPVEKQLVYFGARGYRPNRSGVLQDRHLQIATNKNADVYLKFRNSADSGLGIPLPAGDVRVYKRDPADDSIEFIGEDETAHASRDENILVRMGTSFDLAGERRQTSFSCKYNEHWIRESFEIVVRNHKDEPADVIVREVLYRWVNWEIEEKSQDYEQVDSRTIHFPVTVPANGEKKVTYKVHYTW